MSHGVLSLEGSSGRRAIGQESLNLQESKARVERRAGTSRVDESQGWWRGRPACRVYRRTAGTSGSGVFGKLENLADDQVSGVVDDVAIQVLDLVSPPCITQSVTGDRPERVVLPDLVDRPGHRVAGVDLGLLIRGRPCCCLVKCCGR